MSELVDELVSSFGARRVLLAITARLIKRTRPPDTTGLPALHAQPGVDDLPDDIRADIGLPPKRERVNPDLLAGYVSRHWM
ncbi:hypothetical protein [uncultured Litoreibacter sp.]|uniref:hypothetical protein n=1 Tax=uncultured Litoreibacter sp. TaxID=1392394 RepID=UPI002630CCC8|nr:hypothetical protein [uncultured Litoreibacter sp.]